MDIAVLIKQVPVSNNVSVDPETHALIRASAEGMINPADLNAIEEAWCSRADRRQSCSVYDGTSGCGESASVRLWLMDATKVV